MAIYTYQASETDLSIRSGTVVADTPRQARDLLRQRGLCVQQVLEHKQTGPQSLWRPLNRLRFGTKYSPKAASFIRELSTLLGVGIPLLEAIDIIAEQHRGPFHAILLFLRDQVSAGISLADAMRQRSDAFDELCVNIVEVGEQAGNLDGALARLAEFQDKSRQFKDRISTALIYPCIVLTMALFVSVFLMTYVVPNLLKARLLEAGQPLPLATRIVKGASDFLISDWWLVLLVVFSSTVLIGMALRTHRGRIAWHRLLLRLPVVGPLMRKQAVVRAATVLAALLKSGIVFDRALRIVQKSCKNLVIRNALERCERAIHAGGDIAKVLGATKAFPATAIQVFAVGQRSGRLEEMLERLARDYDAEIQVASQRLTAALEPALILVMVFVVGLIAFATILPMLEASNVM